METTKTIVEHSNTETISSFVLRPGSKIVEVTAKSTDNNKLLTVNQDISAIWTALTAAERTVVRKFFKQIGAARLEVAEGSVTGDIITGA